MNFVRWFQNIFPDILRFGDEPEWYLQKNFIWNFENKEQKNRTKELKRRCEKILKMKNSLLFKADFDRHVAVSYVGVEAVRWRTFKGQNFHPFHLEEKETEREKKINKQGRFLFCRGRGKFNLHLFRGPCIAQATSRQNPHPTNTIQPPWYFPFPRGWLIYSKDTWNFGAEKWISLLF